jgi:hypothetical protein
MKKSPYKQRTKKRKKGCPDQDGKKYSLQPTGEKDKNGKDIMKCQVDMSTREDMMNKKREEEMDPGKQTGPTKVPSRPATKM